MATITFQGNPVHTVGNLPTKASHAPAFTLTKTDLSDITLGDFAGKKVILNIFPSLDTGVCAASVRKFNAEAAALPNTKILCVSMDLPFAQQRFCGAEGINHVIPVSAFRHPEFGTNFGVTITDGKLADLLSRAIVVIDEHGKVIYTEQVGEITHEPDYQAALMQIKG